MFSIDNNCTCLSYNFNIFKNILLITLKEFLKIILIAFFIVFEINQQPKNAITYNFINDKQ